MKCKITDCQVRMRLHARRAGDVVRWCGGRDVVSAYEVGNSVGNGRFKFNACMGVRTVDDGSGRWKSVDDGEKNFGGLPEVVNRWRWCRRSGKFRNGVEWVEPLT